MSTYSASQGRKWAADMAKDLDAQLRERVTRDLEAFHRGAVETSPVGDPSAWRSKHKPPAGYQGGSFAGAWLPFVGSAPDAPAGLSGSNPSARSVMRAWRPGMPFGVVNNKPQGRLLEFHAHSPQVGRDFHRHYIRAFLSEPRP